MGPQFEAMAEQYPFADCYKVDVDDNQEVAQSCGITAMPTFKFYRYGKQVAEFKGADVDKLRSLLTEHAWPPTSLAVGTEVQLFALKSRPELNGRRGAVTLFDPTKGRFAIEVPATAEGEGGAETVALRRENLVLACRVAFEQPSDGSDGVLPASCPEGGVGYVSGYVQESHSYLVKLGDGDETCEVPASCCKLPDGAVGIVVGLQGAPQYNGKAARVLGMDATTGRYEVSLEGGKRLKMKRGNVRV